jgi:hypothetical protein
MVLLDTFTDKVVLSVNMFGLSVVFGILGECLGTFIIYVERDCRAWAQAYLAE